MAARADKARLILPPTATGGIARAAYARAVETGLNVNPLLTRSGLTVQQAKDARLRIPVKKQIAFLDLIANSLSDEFLGVHLALEVELRELGLLYYIQSSSETLGQALQRLERYSFIMNEGVHINYRDRKGVVVRFEYSNVGRWEDQQQIEFFIATLIRLCRHLCGRRISPVGIKLAHRRTRLPTDIRAFLGCDVKFGNDVDEVAFEDSVRTLPVFNADPYLNLLLLKYGDEALSTRSRAAKSWQLTVENAIVPLLPHGEPEVAKIAEQLSVSQRTLARRLADEGTTFKGLLDGLRFGLAKRYLRERDLPISEIAWLLGYGQVSSFHHAFKRWSGRAPKQMRFRD